MRYSLGLDIGIASVGWAVLNFDTRRIEALGVRAFNAAEDPKTRAPLAEPRRVARGARRRLRRRALRLAHLRALLAEQGLVSGETALVTPPGAADPWTLRAEGLERRLDGPEFARVLFHLAKHRGFKSNRLAEGDQQEDGVIRAAVERNAALLREKGYRTVGEMMARDEQFAERKRNTAGAYSHTVSRAMLKAEARELFAAQARCGNPAATQEFCDAFLEIFARQLPFASGEDVLAKVGPCTFEPEEKRAPRGCYTSERATLLQKLNHLRWHVGGTEQRLLPEQRAQLSALAHERKQLKYEQVRKALKLSPEARFVGLSYRRADADALKSETATFVEMQGFHILRETFKKAGLWDDIRDDADVLDTLGEALTFYKTEEDLRAFLAGRGVTPEIIDVAATIPGWRKVGHLSLKALRRMLPHLEAGLVHSDACLAAGYNHSAPQQATRGDRLPLLPDDLTRNPVVRRALTQARKVVNAVIARYGAPWRIHIELGRDMGRSKEERREIEQRQKDNEAQRNREVAQFRELFPHYGREFVSAEDLLKLRLYNEQGCKCAYSLRPFVLEQLLDPGYAEIDHVLPYSRSFDDGTANKVLVFTRENRDKANRTPHEYFGHDSARWDQFEGWVLATIRDPRKRRALLATAFDERTAKDWRERNLTDTQHIAREFHEFVAQNLRFADPEEKVPVVCVKGQVTALARRQWGLRKDREADDLHHAMDAAVVAALTPRLIQRMTEYRQLRETCAITPDGDFVDRETGEVLARGRGRHFTLPQPWPDFRKELLARLSEDPTTALRAMGHPGYAPEEAIAPIIVSRMPQRGATGALHAETVRSTRRMENEGVSTVRVRLTKLSTSDLKNLVARESDPALYTAICARMAACHGKADRAFAEPLHKPCKDGTPGPVVRAVQVARKQTTGVQVRGGIADNGGMVRVDVFHQNGKYYLVPVYAADVIAGRLPNRAITRGKHEEDWVIMDDSYNFLFSVYPYDLVRVLSNGQECFGYYRGTDRSVAAIVISPPNTQSQQTKVGVKTATTVEKYEITVLGEIHRVRKEPRRGVADDRDRERGVTAHS